MKKALCGLVIALMMTGSGYAQGYGQIKILKTVRLTEINTSISTVCVESFKFVIALKNPDNIGKINNATIQLTQLFENRYDTASTPVRCQ